MELHTDAEDKRELIVEQALRAGKSSATANPSPTYFLMVRLIFMNYPGQIGKPTG